MLWRGSGSCQGHRALLPALSANFSPSSSSVEEIYTLWVQKRLLEGKRKGRERKRMKMILIFFFWRRNEADIESE